jgi:hypothetical protein
VSRSISGRSDSIILFITRLRQRLRPGHTEGNNIHVYGVMLTTNLQEIPASWNKIHFKNLKRLKRETKE